MLAVVKTGGKQYRVSEGDVLRVEKLPGKEGDKLSLSEVLLVAGEEGVRVGLPLVAGAKVEAEIVEQGRARKVLIYKYKRRKRYRRKKGHRQHFTAIKIRSIKV